MCKCLMIINRPMCFPLYQYISALISCMSSHSSYEPVFGKEVFLISLISLFFHIWHVPAFLYIYTCYPAMLKGRRPKCIVIYQTFKVMKTERDKKNAFQRNQLTTNYKSWRIGYTSMDPLAFASSFTVVDPHIKPLLSLQQKQMTAHLWGS